MKSHIDGKLREVDRALNTQIKQKEQLAVDELKKQAKKAATKVKTDEATLPPIFSIDVDKLIAESHAKEITKVAKPAADFKVIDADVPILFCELECVAKMNAQARVQMALGLWGGKYKKEEGFKSTGKAQEPVYKRSGKEEIDAMFSSIQSCFPPASFPDEGELPADIAKVFDSVWLYGFDVKMASVAQTPNGVAIFKYLAAGEVEYLLFELKTFVPAVKTILEKDAVSVDEAIAFINNLTTEKMKQFCEKGGAMQRAVLSTAEVLYIPTGYLIAERSSKGILLYGLRKSVVTKSEAACCNYEELIGLYTAANRGTTKMLAMLDAIKPQA